MEVKMKTWIVVLFAILIIPLVFAQESETVTPVKPAEEKVLAVEKLEIEEDEAVKIEAVEAEMVEKIPAPAMRQPSSLFNRKEISREERAVTKESVTRTRKETEKGTAERPAERDENDLSGEEDEPEVEPVEEFENDVE